MVEYFMLPLDELVARAPIDHELTGRSFLTIRHELRPVHRNNGTQPGVLKTTLTLTDGLPMIICELELLGGIPMLDVVPLQRMDVAKGYRVLDQGGKIREEHILYAITQVNGSRARVPIVVVFPGGPLRPRCAMFPFAVEFGPYTCTPRMNPLESLAYMRRSVQIFDAIVKAKSLFK